MDKKIKMYYLLSEKGRKNSIANHGDGRYLQKLTIPCSEKILNMKSCRVNKDGEIFMFVGFKGTFDNKNSIKTSPIVIDYEFKNLLVPEIITKSKEITFDEIKSAKDLIEFQHTLEEHCLKKHKEVTELFSKADKEYSIKKKQEQEEMRKKNEESIKRHKEEIKKYHKDKDQWINKYGSEYLKTAYNRCYDCEEQYVLERISKTRGLKGFVTDFLDDFDFDIVKVPSIDALKQEEELIKLGYNPKDIRIVYFTGSPDFTENIQDEFADLYDNININDEDHLISEGIIIDNFLGKYTLLKNVVYNKGE